MCGISGEIVFSGRSDTQSTRAMGISLEHRGENGMFFFDQDNVSVVFNWLAITDKYATPPARYGKWIVWLNGEIYNHNELRKEFSDVEFKTKSDTESVCVGIDKQGLSFIKKLNGIFIIVAYNVESHTLHIARDRFGAKQIYYYSTPKKLIFSSEPKAFLKHRDYSFDINKNAVGQWLTYQNYFNDEILFDKIKLLQPGTILHCLPSPIREKYHRWEFSENECLNPLEIKDAIRKSCDMQRPKEDIGLWLSGGLDSAILAKEIQPDYCITAGWEEKEYDERKMSELASYNICNNIHQQIFLTPRSLQNNFTDTIRALDDLRAGPSWSNYILNKVISKHCRITIQGTGADELFGGYQWRYDEPDYSKIINKTNLPDSSILHDFERPILPKNIFERYEFDIINFLQGVLIVGDRLSMAHGIEERIPFLDNDIANMALNIPIRYKQDKKILRELYKGVSPFKKKGFTSPDKVWYNGVLKEWLTEILLGSKNLPEFIDSTKISEAIETNNAPAIWSLLALDSWINIYTNGK